MINFPEAEQHLKAIAEETRLKIVAYLTIDTFCVCELVELLDMSQPSISQHLKRLKQAKFITEEKKGKWVFYSLNRKHPSYTLVLHLVGMLPNISEEINTLIDSKRITCN